MPFHRTVAAFYQRGGGPVTLAYKRSIKSRKICMDKEQLSLGAALDSLYSSLASSSSERVLIPDEHIDAAARYYGGSSSLSSGNFAGIAVATAHSFVNHAVPKGIYVHGSVGVGKSMLMDLFYSICDMGFIEEDGRYKPINRRSRRCHFHEFMLDQFPSFLPSFTC